MLFKWIMKGFTEASYITRFHLCFLIITVQSSRYYSYGFWEQVLDSLSIMSCPVSHGSWFGIGFSSSHLYKLQASQALCHVIWWRIYRSWADTNSAYRTGSREQSRNFTSKSRRQLQKLHPCKHGLIDNYHVYLNISHYNCVLTNCIHLN